jgi:hypothetical protein
MDLKKELAEMGIVIFVVMFFLAIAMLTGIAHADQTPEFEKISFQPYYFSSGQIPANFNVSAPFNISTPDGISKVLGATINVQLFLAPPVVARLWVNNQTCNTLNFTIPSGYAAGQYVMSFDCSNIITKAGIYNFTANYNRTTDSGVTWIELAYLNNPNGQIKYVGGTDYWQGETATVFVQLQDASGSPVNNASCIFNLYNATNPLLGKYYSSQPLVFLGSNGMYYYQFSTLNYSEGVYPVDASCSYVFDNLYFYPAGSTQLINVTMNSGTLTGGSPFNLNSYSDGLYMTFTGAENITFRWDNVTNATGNITDIDLIFSGDSVSPRTFNFYAFNYTGNKYDFLGSLATEGSESVSSPTGIDSLFTADLNPKDFISSTNNVSVQIVDTGAGVGLAMNWLTLQTYRNSSVVASVKGSSEVHVYSMNITNSILNGASNSSMNNLLLMQINSTMSGINSTVGSILAIASDINLTAHQTLALASDLNLTASQILAIAQQINASANDIDYVVHQNNITLQQILAYVNATNTTVGSILTISGELNLTAAQILQVAIQSNLTANQILQVVQQINTTANSISLAQSDILALANATNMSVSQIYAAVNTQILPNLTDIDYIVHANNATLRQILMLANETNMTAAQTYALLQDMNLTFEAKLDALNNTLDSLTVNLTTLIGLAQDMNLTTSQALELAQETNMTTLQTYALLLGMNQTLQDVFVLTNATNVTAGGILFLSQQTNQTVNQILGIVQALNVSINMTLSGNVTLNSTLSSGQIDNISQKVWLEFLTLGTPPLLPSTSYSCLDNATLLKNNTFQVCTGSGCSQFSRVDQIYCAYGCDSKNNACMPDPATTSLMLLAILVAIIITVVVIYFWTRRPT